ncbi:type IV toxin-antitoxin system AbiEi family antitoxin domain-containing protein [Candidatus Nomurabacteria bacterium]|nr:type IV toxin-antitoxin system AbiEi family antitoxin domain-containing protein [Candidatus Kaiserbacteria bacterium]MCB9814774.1 type IV toxin-antitoxin system AbiEi family antitoxin domain-containing protein [Candidatus Nomurabacteria bacterium]
MDKKPVKGEYLEVLLRSSKTIFSTKDVALLWREGNKTVVSDRLKSYVKSGKLIRVHRGFYAKDHDYNSLELATRIYTPSYVSFETVLTREGVNFQFYGNIFVASYIKREVKAGNQMIQFVRVKDDILSNSAGVEHINNFSIATQERAFLDRLYVSKDYHFDNLANLNWKKVFEILPIYKNKRLQEKVDEYFADYNEI